MTWHFLKRAVVARPAHVFNGAANFSAATWLPSTSHTAVSHWLKEIIIKMEEIRDAEYLHFQLDPIPYWGGKRIEAWKLGETYHIGDEFNPFFAYYHYGHAAWQSGGLKGMVSLLESILPQLQSIPGQVSQQLIKRSAIALRDSTSMIRELIFEEVRREFFREYPSRQRCIWVVPSLEGARFWNGRVAGNKRWLILSLNGRIHRTSDEYFKSDTMPLSEVRDLALKYWSGVPAGDPYRDEILFEGTAKVIAMRSDAEIGLAESA